MPTTTTRLILNQWIGSDAPSQIRIGNASNMGILDNAAIYKEGAISGRPAPAAAPHGEFWKSTDVNLTTLTWNTGNNWMPVGLVPQQINSNLTLTSGQAAIGVGSLALSLTLPSHSYGQVIGVTSMLTGGAAITVSGTNILGYGLASGGASSFVLGAQGASVILADDSVNWNIVSGMQDTGWVAFSSFGTGCSAAGGTYTPGGRLIGDRTWLRGGIAITNTNNGTLGTLPASVRTGTTAQIIAPLLSNGAQNVQVNTNGTLVMGGISGGGPFTASLDGCSYTII